MNAANLKSVHRLITMGSSSLLQYVSEAVPWSADSVHAAFTKVQALAGEERDEVVRLMRVFQKRHLGLPRTGTYPSHFTTMNFVSLDYLLPKLIAETQREIAELQGNLLLADDDEETRGWIQGFLDMKQKHLQALQDWGTTKSPAAA